MKRNTLFLLLVAVFALAGLAVVGQTQGTDLFLEVDPPQEAAPQREIQAAVGTTFTYQGQLVKGGEPADGAHEFQFALYDAAEGGTQVGITLTQVITVVEGLFTAPLDFGSDVFTGETRYLEIGVRPKGTAAYYTPLSPRQALTPAPYALYALRAGAVDWSGISNVPPGVGGGVQSVAAGAGLAGGGTDEAVTLTVAFSGTGSLDMAARSDHRHDGDYAPLTHMHSFTATDVLRYFEEQALVPTNGARDWEFFTIGSDSYLAVANGWNDSTYNIDSKIYRWNGTSFVETQSIPTNCAVSWEFFTIGSDSYLAVANLYNGSTYNIDSKIYRWNGTSFVETQSISTNAASDWEFFTIGSDSYLAVANAYNDSTYNIDSKIYRWNGVGFVESQSIPTNGANDWEFFTRGSDSYLAVANARNDSTRNVDSKIYRWNGASFAEFQSIPTNGANDWEFFTSDSDSYLAVANAYNGSTYNVDSKIYRWNGASFVEFQSIPTNGADDWEFFTIGSDFYLVVANYRNGSTFSIDSKIFQWSGTSFTEFQSVPTNGAMDWEFFTIGSDSYLAVANYTNGSTRNLDSKIYKATLQSRAGTTYLWGQNGLDVYYNDGNVGIGTTSPQSALQVEGYVQLDVLTAVPPAADCDEASELGRMKVDVVNNLLYICTNSGWIAK